MPRDDAPATGRLDRLARALGLPPGWEICLWGVVWREGLRFAQQKERFLAALVRPLVWLFIFAAGLRSVLGVSLIAPYRTYVLYEVYVTPGLMAMILLFQGMQSALSMVYDRETGAMRTLLIAPYPRWFLLLAKLKASVAVGTAQVYAFMLVAWLYGVSWPAWGWLTVLPALALSGMMFGAVGLLMSSLIRQLENFAGVMNFVIFPTFFASSALYPLWRLRESSPLLHDIAFANPFTHCVELIRFALHLQVNWLSLGVVTVVAAAAFALAALAYDPGRGLMARRG